MRAGRSGSRPPRRRAAASACAAFLGLGVVAGAAGAPAPVTHLDVRADAPVRRADELAGLIEIEIGRPLDAEAIRHTLRNIQAAGLADDVELRSRREDEELAVSLLLRTRIQVERVDIEGRLELPRSTLRAALAQNAGEPLSESRIVRGVYRLQDLYAERSYLDASVRVEVDVDPAAKSAIVTYRIDSGEPTLVGSVEFENGVSDSLEASLREQLRAGPGKRYRTQVAAEDAERLESWLIAAGYRLARVGRPRITLANQTVDLVYLLQLGPRFEMRYLGVDPQLLRRRGLVRELESERFDEALMLQTVAAMRRDFQQRGHYRVEVDWHLEHRPEVAELMVRVDPGPLYELTRIEFRGNSAVASPVLAELMETSERRLLRAGSGRLVDQTLQDDLTNLASFYAQQGFWDARVGPPEIVENGDELGLVIPIEEGAQRRVVDLELRGNESREVGLAQARVSLVPGGPYHPRLLDETLREVRAIYQENGYLSTQVSAQLDWDDAERLVDVRLDVLEGPRTLVDRVIVRGNQKTRRELILRAVRLKTGKPVRRADLLAAQRRLYALNAFSRADVRFAPAEPFAARRDVLVHVTEARPQTLIYGVGYDSETGIRALGGYVHANLLGRGVSGRFDVKASEREQQARLLIRYPYLAGWNVPATFSLFGIEERQESFDSIRRGFQFELEHGNRPRRESLLFTYKLVEVEAPDPALAPIEIDRDLAEVEIASLSPGVLIDRRDDPLLPTRGWSSSLQAEYAFPLLAAETEFVKLFAQGTRYVGLGRLGVLAGSARVGAIEPLGTTERADPTVRADLLSREIPISERFFAGGRTTHRAYRRDALGIPGETILLPEGPGSDRRVPVGGTGLLLLNLDYRFPIGGAFGGTLFADAGNVWADWRGIDASEVELGAGVGVRYLSPIGPLRLEIGWKIDRAPGQDPAVVFISFGNPF